MTAVIPTLDSPPPIFDRLRFFLGGVSGLVVKVLRLFFFHAPNLFVCLQEAPKQMAFLHSDRETLISFGHYTGSIFAVLKNLTLFPIVKILKDLFLFCYLCRYKGTNLRYEKIQHLTSSILPAKSESLHQCEMDNKVER